MTIWSVRTSLIGPVYLDLSIWTCLFGQVYLDLSLWTHLLGPIYLDPSIWTSLFGSVYWDLYIWTYPFGVFYLDPFTWALLLRAVYLNLSAWTRLFPLDQEKLPKKSQKCIFLVKTANIWQFFLIISRTMLCRGLQFFALRSVSQNAFFELSKQHLEIFSNFLPSKSERLDQMEQENGW